MRIAEERPFFMDHSITRPSVLIDTNTSPRSDPLRDPQALDLKSNTHTEAPGDTKNKDS